MNYTRNCIVLLAAVVFSQHFGASASAQSMTVSSVQPSGKVSGGTLYTVSGSVFSSHGDGSYLVSGYFWNATINLYTSISQVSINVVNGVATFSIPNQSPPGGFPNDQGQVFIEVMKYGTGVSAVGTSNINW